MYESYSWPGAISVKEEVKVIIKWIKKILASDVKDIKGALLETK